MRWTLSVKIASGIASILIVATSVSVILNVASVGNQLMDDSRHYAMHLSEVAQAGLESAMIIKDPERIENILKSICTHAEIMGAAVFNKRGEIKYSMNPGDVGRTFSKNDPMCTICHDRTPADQTQTVIWPSKEGARILKVVRPIINKPVCQGCHRERVLGMLVVDLSLAEVDQRSTAVLGQQIRQSLATMAIVIVAIMGLVYLIVTRPLANFLQIARAIDNGDLSRRVKLSRKDEIGVLGESFDRMVANIEVRTRELEKLNKIATEEIAERKRIEEALRLSEEKHRILYEKSSDAIMTLAPPSWRFTTGNAATVKMFATADEAAFTELGPWELSPEFQPDGRPSSEKAAEMIQTAMAQGSHFFKWTHRRLRGESFPATVLLTRTEISGQALLQATVRDITENDQWEQAQMRLVAMLDATPGFVGFADAGDTHILYINPTGRKMIGVQAEEDVTRLKIADVHPEWTNKLLRDEIIPTAIRDGLWTGECAFLDRDGHETPVMMVLIAHKKPSGEVERFSTVSIDITDRKQAEEEKRSLQERLQRSEKMEALGLEDIRILLSNGADKVSINSAAIENPQLVNDSSKKFGVQCIVLSIDYKKDEDGFYYVYKKSGKIKTELCPLNWAIEGEKRGAGEILITSIEKDGLQNGLDIFMTQKISEAVNIPVITSGGCGLASHFSDGFTKGKADGVSAGTFFCFKDQNPMQTRSHIKNAGISIRMHT